MGYSMMQALGADPLGFSQYQERAVAGAVASGAKFVLVKVARDGSIASRTPYPTHASLMATWDWTKLGPNDAFAIAYDATLEPDFRVVESQFNPLAQTITTRKLDLVGLVPWAIGGALLVTAAVVLTRPAKGKARKRARPTWRRRMVTVWR